MQQLGLCPQPPTHAKFQQCNNWDSVHSHRHMQQLGFCPQPPTPATTGTLSTATDTCNNWDSVHSHRHMQQLGFCPQPPTHATFPTQCHATLSTATDTCNYISDTCTKIVSLYILSLSNAYGHVGEHLKRKTNFRLLVYPTVKLKACKHDLLAD